MSIKYLSLSIKYQFSSRDLLIFLGPILAQEPNLAFVNLAVKIPNATLSAAAELPRSKRHQAWKGLINPGALRFAMGYSSARLGQKS